MPSTLRQVLQLFEESPRPLSLAEMAHTLDIEQNMLEGMIEYWVRKGKIRASDGDAPQCTTCGKGSTCPYVSSFPRRYELRTGEEPDQPLKPPCSCCG
ncbi:MAG: hypothetical protein Kow0077_20760 [Anaerolineae bacterium]